VSARARAWRRYRRSRSASVAAIALALLCALALLAPLISPQNPYDLAQLDVVNGRLPPGTHAASGTLFLLGTDEQGRDMLSAILFGLRVSLTVGLTSTIIALGAGAAAGILASYAGGASEALLMRAVDLQLSFPAVLVALVLLSVLGQGSDKVIAALALSQWAYFARSVRGAAVVEMAKDYVAAARGLALPGWRIIAFHLLPNCLPPLIVVATVQCAAAITLEATLSFLGLGVPITRPSLGLLIADGFQYLLAGQYWISLFPGIALVALIACINLTGDGLREALSPRLNAQARSAP
jgi:peptide/nickel transport system permease protein